MVLGEERLDSTGMMTELAGDHGLAWGAGEWVAHILAEGVSLPERQRRHPFLAITQHFCDQRVPGAECLGRETGNRPKEVEPGERGCSLADGPKRCFHSDSVGDLSLEPRV